MKLDNKRWANILLVAAVLNIARLIAGFFQTKYTLISPLIRTSIIAEVAAPQLFNALLSSIAMAVALMFYFYSRYIAAIIICACTIVLPATVYYIFFPI